MYQALSCIMYHRRVISKENAFALKHTIMCASIRNVYKLNISGGQPALSQGTIHTRFLTSSHFLQLYSLPPSPCRSSNPSRYRGRQSWGSSALQIVNLFETGQGFFKGLRRNNYRVPYNLPMRKKVPDGYTS